MRNQRTRRQIAAVVATERRTGRRVIAVVIGRGTVISIPPGDHVGGTVPLELLLTQVPDSLHPAQEWVHVKGVELDAEGVATDLPIAVLVRAALLREVDSD